MTFKYIYIVFITVLFISCDNSKQRITIKKLEAKNDSLEFIIQTYNQKYIFDSISLRDIPSNKNNYKNGTYVSGEIVIVGYNANKKTNVIFADSISYNPELKLYKPDSLKLINGGFLYRKKLDDSLKLRGVIEIKNYFGKSKQLLYESVIKAKE